MCVSKIQHVMGRKTGFNRSRPVFFGFSIFWQTSQLATEKIQNFCNRNRWSGLLRLGSVRFRSFFQSSELDLRTLGGTKMRRGRTCRVWPDNVRYHRHSQQVNNLNRISTYMSWISKYSQAPKRRNPTVSFLRALFSYRQIFQSFWTGASYGTTRCQRVLQLFSPFVADLAANDSSKRLLGASPITPISHFLKRELLQMRPMVGGYIAFWAIET